MAITTGYYSARFGIGLETNWFKRRPKKTSSKALEPGESYKRTLLCVASLIPKVVADPKFPKRRQAQINFLADSLAGLGTISPRRSRDICEQERAKQRKKTRYRIIRREYYIECSCGYKGLAQDDACRKCGAEIPFHFGVIEGLGFR